MNANKQLEFRKVSVIRKEWEKVLVGSGLAGEERIIFTHIFGAANLLMMVFVFYFNNICTKPGASTTCCVAPGLVHVSAVLPYMAKMPNPEL
jgi:hypothetical protein